MTVATETERSLRHELAEFIQEVMEREDTTSVEKLVRLAHRHFNGDDWIREALIREGLNSLVPEIAGMIRHRLRQRARETLSDEGRYARIASVFEHVGYGISKSIPTMTRPEHLYAALERETAAAGHLRWAGFHRAVAALHTDDETPTGALPQAEVESLFAKYIERDD